MRNKLNELNVKFDIHKCIGKRFKQPSNQSNKYNKQVSLILEQQQLNEIKKFDDEKFKLNDEPTSVQNIRIVCDNMLGIFFYRKLWFYKIF